FSTEEEEKELKQQLSLYGMNFSVYEKILPLTKLASEQEQSTLPPSEQLKGARLHAAKLAILFDDAEKAIEYLKRYEKQYPNSKQLIHDACLFSLPEGKWNVSLWRGIIANQNPSRPNDLIMRFLPFAKKIEDYVKDNRTILKTEVEKKITAEYTQKFLQEYDTKLKEEEKNNQKGSEQIKNESIEKYLAAKMKSIKTEWDKKFDSYLRSKLSLSERSKLEGKDRENLALRKKNLNLDDKKTLLTIKAEVMNNYRKKAEESYKQWPELGLTMESKEKYIEQQLQKTKKEIEQKIQYKKSNLLTAKTSLEDINAYSRHAFYQHAGKHPEAAELFFYYGIKEKNFDEYLSLKSQDDPEQIPNITIKGEEINPEYTGYYLKKLPPSDPRAAILGKLTSCCQSIGDEGSSSAKHGITDPRGGFYVLCKKTENQPETILAQCWAWRSQANTMVFDSVESQIDFRNKSIPQMIPDFYTYLAALLVQKYNVPRVSVGRGGETPPQLGILNASISSKFVDYYEYSDAKKQSLIADKELPLIQVYNELNATYMPSILNAMSRESLLEWADLLVLNNKQENSIFIDCVEPLMDKAGLKKEEFKERIELTKAWLKYLNDKNKDISQLKSFINKGVNPNLTNDYGKTVLYEAASDGNTDMAQCLVGHGADVNAKDNYGITALHRDAYANKWDIIRLLVEKGVDNINAKEDMFGRTVLHMVASDGKTDMAQWRGC
ncbi:ankyrin repeat domain-containing protein, partial [Legionella sp.]|uniref:ankyrin repeat domain-containing protein n=1 Tax=Legionella sp. TaxID=459 RepID=UPI003CA178FD